MSNTISIKPTPTEYTRMLVLLVRDGTELDDRQWAGEELIKLVSGLEEALDVANNRLDEANKLGLYWQAEAETLMEAQDD